MEHASVFNPQRKVTVRYRGAAHEVFESTTLESLMLDEKGCRAGGAAPIAASVNNRIMPLDTNVFDGADVSPVFFWDPQGEVVYRRSLSILLQAAVRELYPSVRLLIGQSMGGGYFYLWTGAPALGQETLRALEKKMRQMVADDLPLTQERCGAQLAQERFRAAGMEDRVLLLRTWWHETLKLVHLGSYVDVYHGPLVTSTRLLPWFALHLVPPGIILQFPEGRRAENPTRRPHVTKQLFDVCLETYEWNKILGVGNVGQLNGHVLSGMIDEILRVSEGLHEKKVASIVDMALARAPVRIILAAGPSSSGKTTFSKRLAIQLKVAGRTPVIVSVDNYYVDRDRTPRDEKGEYDFEALEAIDLPLLGEHLERLIAGEAVRSPRYGFEAGRRMPESKWETLRLVDPARDIIVIEGIHALNERLTQTIPREKKFKVYVSALSQLCLDDTNRISTTDVRLLRRLVRDRLYRGYNARDTIAKWPSVKRGEARNIFPFQGDADVMFNSTLPYELSVLKVYAEKFLLEVPQDDPSFPEAYRLLKFLSLLVPVFPDKVPHTSIIREFIGGSHFHY